MSIGVTKNLANTHNVSFSSKKHRKNTEGAENGCKKSIVPYVAAGLALVGGLALTAGLLRNNVKINGLKIVGGSSQISLKGVTFAGKTQINGLDSAQMSKTIFKKGASLIDSTIKEGDKIHKIEGLSFIKDTSVEDLLKTLNKNT